MRDLGEADTPAGHEGPFAARLPPVWSAIAPVCDGADALAAERGASERARYALRVVLEELLTNIAKYSGARESVDVRVDVGAGAISVRISDDGVPFDLTSATDPSIPATLADAKVGGLGLTMVRSAVSELAWRRESGRNVVMARIQL